MIFHSKSRFHFSIGNEIYNYIQYTHIKRFTCYLQEQSRFQSRFPKQSKI